MALPVTLEDVHAAREVLKDPVARGVVKPTPTVASDALSEMCGRRVLLKLENLQRTGAFKVRGAYNKIASLSEEEQARGVIAASAGNHAQGVALAARDLGASAVICMPEDAPISKVHATRKLGAEVVLGGQDYNQAYEEARRLEKERSLTFVHPYDDPLVIAGQGTVGLELLEACQKDGQVPEAVVVGVGGGGLISGIAVALKALSPGTRIIGVEPAGAAALTRSREAGGTVRLDRVDTIADGLATREAGALALEITEQLVDDVVTVEDDAIANAILFLLEQEKLLAEGAGATATAALMEDGQVTGEGPVVSVISGGNIDVTLLEHVIDRGLVRSGRYVKFDVPVPDRPGALHNMLGVIADEHGNIHRVTHDHRVAETGVRTVVVRVEVETRGPDHVADLLDALSSAGYEVRLDA